MGVSIAPTKTWPTGPICHKQLPQINGVCLLHKPEQWQWLAQRTPVAEVWGVGRRLTQKLQSLGVNTAAELAALPHDIARQIAGITLVRTVRELNGVFCIPMEEQPPAKQQILCSRSFGEKLTSLPALQQAISQFAVRAAEKLRLDHSEREREGGGNRAGRISAFIQTSAFDHCRYADSHSRNIPGGTNDARQLSRLASEIVAQLYQPGFNYAKAGVCLLDIRPAQYWQQDLFAAQQPSQTRPHQSPLGRSYGGYRPAQPALRPRHLAIGPPGLCPTLRHETRDVIAALPDALGRHPPSTVPLMAVKSVYAGIKRSSCVLWVLCAEKIYITESLRAVCGASLSVVGCSRSNF